MKSTRRATRQRSEQAAQASMRLVPVARHGRCGLLRTTALQAVALFGLAAVAAAPRAVAQPAPNARPQGGAVVGGSASISQSPTTTSVKQSSARAAVDWSSFDVGSKQTVTFTAPSASDVTLNQVTGPDPSQIAGHIVANDQLVLVNRSGVVFSKGAEVDTAGLVVSASGIAPAAFMQGSATFDVAPNPGAKITNQGAISVKDRGLAALVAPQVANDGVITARMGRVTLAGAEAHTVDLYGDGMLSINVTKQVTKASLGGRQVDALVTNSGLVRADGGTVTLTAQAVDGLVTTLVSAGGRVAADTVGGRAGTVLIDGAGGSVRVTGEVSAQGAAAGARGGSIEVDATQVASVAAGASLNASGAGGGGVIAVGTTLARAQGGPSVKPAMTARGTLVEKGATLAADATVAGRGGKVAVLSTEATVFSGAITARGGAQSGDGGSAEVSGAGDFSLTGAADLSAAHGARGSLLIDPTNLDIVAAGGNVDGEIGASGSIQLLMANAPDPGKGVTASVDVPKLQSLLADIELQASQTITVLAPITLKHALTLQAGDALTVTANAPISATSITLSAATASIAGATTTGALTVNAALTATDKAAGTVTLSGGTNGVALNSSITGAGLAVVSAGKITFGAGSSVDVGAGTADLSSVGVAQDPTSSITAAVLQSQGGFFGPASFAGTANAISALGDIKFANGGFTLVNAAPLTVQGAVGPGAGTGGDIRLAVGTGAGQTLTLGSGTAKGSLLVDANYSISLSADAIAVGKAGASVVTDGAAIEIAPLTAGRGVSVNGAAANELDLPLASLGLSGGVGGTLRIGSANGVTTAKDVSFDGATTVSTFAALDVEATGAVTQATGAALSAPALTGAAASLALTTGANAIQTLAGFAATGDVALTQAGSLLVLNKVGGANVALTVTQAGGTINVGNPNGIGAQLAAAKGGAIALIADKVFGNGSSATAPGGVVRIGPSNSEAVVVGGGSFPTIELPAITAATVSIGTVGKATSITFQAATNLGAAALDLETSGAASQTNAGGVTAAGLTGSVGSLDFASQGATNAVTAIGPLTATTGAVSLTTGGALAASGAIAAPAGAIKLTSGGAFTQSSGSIVAADTLTVSGAAGVAFGGELSAATVSLASAGGGITESLGGTSTGTVSATTLTFTSNGGASFATASGAGFGNQVATLGASKATQGVTFVDGRSLALTGETQGADISIAVDLAGGAVDLGNLTPASLTVGAGGALSLVADQLVPSLLLSSTLSAPNGVIEVAPYSNTVTMSIGGASGAGVLGFKTGGGLGALTLDLGSGGTLRLGQAGGVTTAAAIGFAAPLDLSAANDTLDAESLGAVTQTAASPIKASFLTGKAASLDLATAPGNAIGELAGFTATGGVALTQAGPLLVADAVSGANIALTVTQAGGTINVGGGETAATLTAAAGGTIALIADNVFATGASASAPGGLVRIAPYNSEDVVVGGSFATVYLPAVTAATVSLGTVGKATSITFEDLTNIGAATLDLETSGAATQPFGSGVTAGGLTGSVGSLDFASAGAGAPNAIAQIGPFKATTGGVALTTFGDLAASGAVAAPNGDVALTASGGAFTQAAGSVAASATGALTLVGDKGVAFGGTISGGVVVLTATGGKVSESPAGGADTGAVQASRLTATAGAGAIDLSTPSGAGVGNQVAALGASKATGGAFSLVDGIALTVQGAVSGTNVSVAVAPGDTVTFGAPQLAGSLNAATGGVVSVKADGIVESGFGGLLSAPGAGTVEVTPATVGDAIAVGGASAPGTLGISLTALDFATGANGTLRLGAANGVTTAGAITFVAATNLSAVGTLDLEAKGAVTQSASSPLTVAALTGSAASVDLSTAAGNAVGSLGGFTATGGFKLTDASSLTVAGAVKAGAAATDRIALTVTKLGGSITLGSGAVAGALTAAGGAGVSLQADDLLLGAGGGAISAPGATVAIAPFDAGAMIVGGPLFATVELPTVTAATLSLGKAGPTTTATQIDLAGGLALGAVALDLEATGAVTQGAPVTAAALTGTVGSLALGAAGNAIASIGPLATTAGALTLTDGGSLAFGGALAAKTNLSLTAEAGGGTAGDIALTQPLTAGGAITLAAAGQITQSGGALTAQSLSATAAGGQVLLNGTTNAVGVLQASSAAAGFTFENDAALTVVGAVSGASVTLTVNAAGQALTLGGAAAGQAATLTATAATAPTVTLQADVVSLGAAGGSATAKDAAGDGLVQIAPFTPGTAFDTGAGGTATFATDTLRIGEVGGVVTASSILLGSPVAVAGGTLDVEATGLVSQTAAGGVTAAVLIGNVGTLDFLSAGAVNRIGALGAITATSGEIAVGDALDINISQSVSAPSVLLTTGGTISQTAGTITATAANGAVDLTAGGTLFVGGAIVAPDVALVSVTADVTETLPGATAATGVVRTTLLTGSSGGATLLDTASPAGAGNQVAQLGSFAAAGALTLLDGEALSLAGDVSGATVDLGVAGGGLTQTAGTLTAGLLTGAAGGTATFGGAGNQVAQLGAFTATGAFTLLDGEALAIVGDVGSGADVNITTSAGGITQALATTITTTGSLSLTSAQGVAFGGTLDPTSVNLVALNGDVTETLPGQTAPTGVILAPLLTGSAPNGAALLNTPSPAGAGNQVGQLGAFAVQGAFELNDGEALAVVQNVSGASATLLVNGGGITQDAATSIAASGAVSLTSSAGIAFGGVLSGSSVSLAAQGGDVTETLPRTAAPTGVVQTTLLTGSASGAALFTTPSPAGGGNQVAQLGAFAAGGDLTLLDGEALAVVGLASSGGDVALTAAAGITIGGTVSAAGAANLVAQGGDIAETGGVVLANLLTGSATGQASFDTASPAGAGNLVAQLGAFAAGGDLTLLDGEALAVAGAVTSTAGTVALTASGALTQGAGLTISAPAGAIDLAATADVAFAGTLAAPAVSLVAGGDVTETPAPATAPTGVVQTALLTGSAGGAALFTTPSPAGGGNQVAQLGPFAAGGALTLLDGRSLAVVGLASSSGGDVALAANGPAADITVSSTVSAAGAATLTAGRSIDVAGTVTATGGDLTLTASGGAITEGAGGLVADAGAGQTVALTASAGIAFGGTISAAGTASFTAQGGDATETLTGQPGPTGVLLANLLTGSATGSASFATPSPAGAGNLVAQLGAFAAGGSFTLADGEALALVGQVTAPAGFSLTLGAGGFTQAAGQTLSATAAGAVISINVADGIAFGGTLSAPAGTVSLTALGGDVTETAPGAAAPTGVVVAQSLTGSASGMAAFDTPSSAGAGNLVANFGPFSTAGALTLLDGRSLTVSGTVASSAGDVTLTTGGPASDITLTGTVAADGAALLTAGGAITQASGLISGGTGGASLTASGGAISQAAGAVISDPAGAAISLVASAGVAFGGTVTTAGTISLTASGGDITETAAGATAPSGVLLASLLTGSASGQALLSTPSPAGSGNLVNGLGAFATGGNFTLVDGQGLTVSGPLTAAAGKTPGAVTITLNGAASDLALQGDVTAAGPVLLTAGGAITQNSGTLTGTDGTVTLAALGGSISQAAGAVVSDPAAKSTVSLAASGGIAFGGTITTPGTISLVAQGGDVSETAPGGTGPTGVLLAGLLTGSASGQGLFATPSPAASGGNQVAALGPFATGGSLTLLDGRSLTVSGAVASTSGDVALTTDGAASDLTVASSVTASGVVTLTAGAGVAQPSGTITAGGGVSLTASGGSFTQGAGAVVGETGAGEPISVVASAGIAFGGLITTPGAVTLVAQGGDVTETSGAGPTGVLVASSLSGSASGQALFDTASPSGGGNQVADLGSFSTGGRFMLLDGEALAVSGPLTTGGAVDVSVSGSLTLAGDVTAAGIGAFTAGAGIDQSSGTVQAGGATLTLTALGGSITQAGGAALTAPAEGASIGLTAAGGISFGGTVAAPGSISLVAQGGDATETGGVLQTALLTGSTSGQALLNTPSPAGSGNLVAQLGAFAAGGDLTLADGETLTATGSQSAADISITTAASFAQAAGGVMAATGTLTVTAPAGIGFTGLLSAADASLISQTGSIVEAATGVAQFGTLSGSAGGDASLTGGNQIGQLGSLSAGGSLTLQDGQSLTVAGPVTAQGGAATIAVLGADAQLTLTGSVAAPDVTLSAGGAIVQTGGSVSATLGDLALTAGGAGGIAFGGTLAAAQTVTLTASAGGISETAPGAASPSGQVAAATLSGSAAGAIALDGPGNQIGQVSTLSAAGSLTLTDAAALTVNGPLSVPGGTVSLTAGGTGLSVAGPVSASSANLAATAGSVTETGSGLLTLASLTGSAAGSASFGSANQIGSLGAFATGAGFSLTDAGSLSVTGSVSAPQGPVAITAGGGLTQTAGVISGGPGGVTLAAGGAFTQLAGAAVADLDPATGVAVTAQSMALGGAIRAAGAPVTLTAQSGSIAEVGAGSIQAGSLAGSATGAATFGDEAANAVARLDAFTAGGAFELLDGTALTVSGPLAGQTVDIQTPAAVTLAGGRISAAFTPGAAQYDALLAPNAAFPTAADGIFIKASGVAQTGVTMIDPGARAPTTAANPATPGPVLSIELAGGKGTVSFAGLDAPGVQLFLSLGDGSASGLLDVAGLHVDTSTAAGGMASLTGVVAGQLGTSAAGVATISPLRNSRYQINSCPVASVNCILLSPILVPVTNPVQDVEVSGVGSRQDDPDLILPNVGEQDF